MADSANIDANLGCNIKLRGKGIKGQDRGTNITATYSCVVDYTIDDEDKSFIVHNNIQTFVGTINDDGVLQDTSGNDGIRLYINNNNSETGEMLSYTIDEDDVELSFKGNFGISFNPDSEKLQIPVEQAQITVSGIRKAHDIDVSYEWNDDGSYQWIDEDDEDWEGTISGSFSLQGSGYKRTSFEVTSSKTETKIDDVEIDGNLSNVMVSIDNYYGISNVDNIDISYDGEDDDYNYNLRGEFSLSGDVNNQELLPNNVVAKRVVKTVPISGDYNWADGSTEYALTGMFHSPETICKKGGHVTTLNVIVDEVPTVNGVEMVATSVPQTIDVEVSGDVVSSDVISFSYTGIGLSYDYALAGDFEITGTPLNHDYVGNVTVTSGDKKYLPIFASFDDWSGYESIPSYYELAGSFNVSGQCKQGESDVATINVTECPIFNTVQLIPTTIEPTTVNVAIADDLSLSSDEMSFSYGGEDEDYTYGLSGKFELSNTYYNQEITAKEIIPIRNAKTKTITATYALPEVVADANESDYYQLSGTVNVHGTGTIDSLCSDTTITAQDMTINGYAVSGIYTKPIIKIDSSNNVTFNNNETIVLYYTGGDDFGAIYELSGSVNFASGSTTKNHSLSGSVSVAKHYYGYHKGYSDELNIDTLNPNTDSPKTVVSLNGNILTYGDGTTLNLSSNGAGATTTIKDATYIKSNLFQNTGLFSYTELASVNSDFSNLEDGSYMFNGCSELVDFKATNGMNKLTQVNDMFAYCSKLASFYSSMSSLVDADNMFNGCSDLTVVKTDMPNVESATDMLSGCAKLQTWEGSLAKLVDAKDLFKPAQSTLTTVSTDLSSMTDGSNMFSSCGEITTINTNMQSVTNATDMLSGCSKLQEWNGSLAKLVDAKDLFKPAQNSLVSVNSNLTSMTDAYMMFYEFKNLENFEGDLSGLNNGKAMFRGCSKLNNIPNLNLSSLESGRYMFDYCSSTGFTNFESNLDNLTHSTEMFGGCSNLTDFQTTSLKVLEVGLNMFYDCKSLKNVKVDNHENNYLDTSAMIHGDNMFYHCSSLQSMDIDVGVLETAKCMFAGCSELTSFNPINGLGALRTGWNMFSGCKLDATSVTNILTTLNDLTGQTLTTNSWDDEGYTVSTREGTLDLGIGAGAANAFKTLTGVDPTTTQTVTYKGWTINVTVNS